ncbi:hypothetical protein [Phaeodactylibacter luteus]|uniref:YfhO family protein n=1 Tax=Phaeodactylibacter luteus TaxID=1564516 RepID=A0A5C6RIJ9_9BACT|nr:hypothetical protein [Phaeodactylibacter luteus]TXB62258.1 hypothetical protein FRY97_15060 [Phaeodactylibacter luteus]
MKNLRPGTLYLIAFALVQAFYLPTRTAGFVTDFTGLLGRFDGQGPAGIWDCFGFPALQQVLNAILYGMYSLFGTAHIPWYLLQTSLHALNGVLLFLLAQRWLLRLGHARPQAIAPLASLLFLLSPYASEPVTWRVAQNFLLVTAAALGSGLLALKWAERPNPKTWLAIMACFLPALFTFELALIIPALNAVLLLSLPGQRAAHALKVIAPQLALIVGYFFINRALLGSWVGHYGAEVHLRFQPLEVAANFLRYAAKHLLFARYWPHTWKAALFNGLLNPWAVWGLLALLSSALLYIAGTYRQQKPALKLFLLAALCYGASLLPISNLYFNFTLLVENDRYGYLPSAFLSLGLISLLSLLARRAVLIAAAICLLPSAALLWSTNQKWQVANQMYHALLQGFNSYHAEEVYLLNLPDNYQGIGLFRDYSGQDHAFADALRYIRQQPYTGKIHEVAQYNLTRLTDGATAARDSSGQIRVEFEQWGNWWWHRGIGMGSGYRSEGYEVISHGHHYFLLGAPPADGKAFLVQSGLGWKEVE